MTGQGWGNFFLQRRTILCNNPPDLIAVVAVQLHSNKNKNANLIKEIWKPHFYVQFWQNMNAEYDHIILYKSPHIILRIKM